MRNRDKHPPITETNHKIKNVPDRNIKRHYQEQSQTIHKQDTTDVGLSKVPITLYLKWLTDKSGGWNSNL